jgi:hypothetical protein
LLEGIKLKFKSSKESFEAFAHANFNKMLRFAFESRQLSSKII